MTKTFKTLIGETVELNPDFDIRTDFSEDILTNETTNYFVVIEGTKYEVDKITYKAVKEYLENF